MRYGFNTFNHTVWFGLPPTLPAQIDAAANAGFDCVGLDVASLLAHEAAGLPPSAIAEQMAARSIALHELAFLGLSGDRDRASRDLDDVLRLVEVLRPAQVEGVILGGLDAACVEATRTATAALAAHGVVLCLEYVTGMPVDSIVQARELVEAVGRPEAGVCVDAFHFFHGPDTWADLEALPLAELALVQCEDALAIPPGVAAGGEPVLHGRALPGEGHLDLDRFARCLVEKGYDGVVSVEACSRTWRERPLEEFARAALATTRAVWERAGARREGGRRAW